MEEAIVFSYIRWIPLLPLIGFLINGLGARAELGPAGTQRVHWVACLAPFGSFLISVLAFTKLLGLPAEGRLLTDTVFTWIASGEFTANLTFSIDPLSSVMTLVVTGVGLLIHVYSIGYMHGDKGYSRYFAYLKEAKRHSEPTVDAAAKALSRFEGYTRYRDFKAFHFQQAIAFKKNLAEQKGQQSGKN